MIITSADLKGLFDVLKLMAENELAIAELYKTCALVWKEDSEFWLNLEKQEIKHANNINKMMEIISKKTEHFEKSYPFNIVAIKTIMSYVKNNIEKIREGKLPRINALSIARDIEQSLMENKYNEIVKTDDIEYQTLVKEIITETAAHKDHIDKIINEMKK
jgi:hypothetical protein